MFAKESIFVFLDTNHILDELRNARVTRSSEMNHA